MQEMIAAEPALVQALLSDPPAGTSAAAAAIAEALEHDRPVIVCGCGTSEHAAHGIAALLVGRRRPPSFGPRAGATRAERRAGPAPGVCLASRTTARRAPAILALVAARTAGARTIAITHQPDASVARAAERVLLTPRHDDSWCHTVAYTSALATGAALAGRLGPFPAEPGRGGRAPRARLELHEPRADRRPPGRPPRRALRRAGADLTTARELALKIAEGARLPTLALELETVLHGQLAGHEPADALMLVAITDEPDRERIARRAADVARAAAAIGLPVAGLLSDAYDLALPAELTPAGRLVTDLPTPTCVDRRLAGLLAGAGALQTLTLELAHARRTNPDLIRREQAPYRNAAHEAERLSRMVNRRTRFSHPRPQSRRNRR